MNHKIKNKSFGSEEMQGKSFEGVVFEYCKFDSKIYFVNFTKCKFYCCDFSGAMLNIVGFDECQFPESKLSNLDFGDTKLKECNFFRAVIQNSIFQQLKTGDKNKMVVMNLRSCNFEEAGLKGTVFGKCDLTGVSFVRADLEKVSFENCILKEANFMQTNLSGVNFGASKIGNTLLDLDGFIQFGQSKGFRLE